MLGVMRPITGCAVIVGMLASGCATAEAPKYAPAKPEAVWESLNLVANPGFEIEGVEGNPERWRYYGGQAAVEHGLSDVAHSGKKSAYLKSAGDGYHGGWSQTLKLIPNTEYKLSAWVKTKMVDGKVQYVRCDVYDESQEKNSVKNYHGYSAGSTTKSMDWTYFEKIFRTPDTIKSSTVYPVLLWGKGEVWVDDVSLVRRLTTSGRIVFRDGFDQPNRWKLSCHADGEAGASAKETGTTFGKSDTVRFEDRSACRLHYNFATRGHDAAILSREVKVESAGVIRLAVHGDASGHRIFCVLTDVSGERHFLPICEAIDWKGWKVLYRNLDVLAKGPPKYVVEATHFGGDRNQKLDCPITVLAIGLDDRLDAFIGSGDIYFGLVEIMAPRE